MVPDEGYEQTWQRLRGGGTDFHGIGAWSQGKLVGIAHYLFHPTFWMEDSCYLQDLFVDEAARGRGVARMLIESAAPSVRRSAEDARPTCWTPSAQPARPWPPST
ncbi:GNAT family N-acetyltransferase [Streptomyces sp. NPDC059851]|uniref:GNAT family N-acetyltransferase n=1 Tax=Streptomyces sp. NPDC059851 TaxID=3346971 RepID=UPI00365F0C06